MPNKVDCDALAIPLPSERHTTKYTHHTYIHTHPNSHTPYSRTHPYQTYTHNTSEHYTYSDVHTYPNTLHLVSLDASLQLVWGYRKWRSLPLQRNIPLHEIRQSTHESVNILLTEVQELVSVGVGYCHEKFTRWVTRQDSKFDNGLILNYTFSQGMMELTTNLWYEGQYCYRFSTGSSIFHE